MPPEVGKFLQETERFLSDARERSRVGAEAARSVRCWCPGERRGSALISLSWLEGPLCTPCVYISISRPPPSLSPFVRAGTARNRAVEGSVGERKLSQHGGGAAGPAARSDTRGRCRPSLADCGWEQRTAAAEALKIDWGGGAVWGFVLTLKRILPAWSSCAGPQRGGGRYPSGGRASRSPQTSAVPASDFRRARC